MLTAAGAGQAGRRVAGPADRVSGILVLPEGFWAEVEAAGIAGEEVLRRLAFRALRDERSEALRAGGVAVGAKVEGQVGVGIRVDGVALLDAGRADEEEVSPAGGAPRTIELLAGRALRTAGCAHLIRVVREKPGPAKLGRDAGVLPEEECLRAGAALVLRRAEAGEAVPVAGLAGARELVPVAVRRDALRDAGRAALEEIPGRAALAVTFQGPRAGRATFVAAHAARVGRVRHAVREVASRAGRLARVQLRVEEEPRVAARALRRALPRAGEAPRRALAAPARDQVLEIPDVAGRIAAGR